MNDPVHSKALFERALRALPGGVSSPVRAFGAVGGTPRFLAAAKGARLTDVDGNEYLDFVGSWGPLILGHAHEEVLAAVREAAAKGMTFGAPHLGEVELAETIARHYPGIERVRFTSSGTEATMSALRLARGVTGRDRIVKFAGCYHGHSDGLLVAAGSGSITFGQPSSAGVPAAIAALSTVLPLDDTEGLEAFFAAHGAATAAVIIEPIPANNGLLLQRPDFLARLRAITREHGTLLIFDEVISGFRVAMGGAAELYGIEPDLVTFGKIVGGGMPVGAFAGRAELFARLAPEGGIYQAGTLSGNPMAMAAGLATLRILARDRVHERLEELGALLERRVLSLRDAGTPIRIARQGSIFWLHPSAAPLPRRADAIDATAAERYPRFFHHCLDAGIYLAPSAYEVGFLSAAHSSADIERAAAVFATALAEDPSRRTTEDR